jgi:hypothetical protein
MDPLVFLTELLESALQLPQEIAGVATRDPLSAVLVLVGSLMLALSVGAFGYLTLGAVVDLVTPSIGREPPREAR